MMTDDNAAEVINAKGKEYMQNQQNEQISADDI